MLGLSLIVAACGPTATPIPGLFETALAATVDSGSTQIAQGFADQRATLTAGAPTATLTPPPTATPTETPIPTYTPTPAASPTRTPRPATPTRTLPPPPTFTPTPRPLVAGTYLQSGACTTIQAFGRGYAVDRYHTLLVGFFTVCVPAVLIRVSGEMQVNVTWTMGEVMAPNWIRINEASLPPWNGSSRAIYLTDNLGNRYDFTALEGAARDGGNAGSGVTLSGYYLFPPAHRGANIFVLHDDDRQKIISNIILNDPTP